MRLLVLLAALGHAAAQANAEVDGSGTTNPSKFFWQIMETIQARSKGNLRMTYRAVGSSTGQKEFTQNPEGTFTASANDFGAGDIPMTSDRFTSLTGAGRAMVHVPFCLGAIAVFHSIPAAEVGNDGLKLSPCLLAKIFAGKVTTWDHADIKAENPNIAVPAGSKIMVGHRTKGSSSTGGLSGYMDKKCSAEWTLGASSTISWPTANTFKSVEGSPGMTEHIAGVKYAIGYLDAGHGHQRGFAEAALKNEDGNYITSLDAINFKDANGENGVAAAGAAAVAAGAIPTAADSADWSSVNLYSKAGAKTWPIVLVSYIYLLKDMSSMPPAKVGLIKAFVDMVTGTEGQGLLPDFSFNAIPAAMNQWATTWTSITKPSGVVTYTMETSTAAWTGQGADVISAKRNSYSLWKLNELAIAATALETRIKTLETTLNDFGIVALHGSGTTNPKNWFAKAMKLMEVRARAPLHLSYRAVGSSTGQKEFVGDDASGFASYNHFGSGDIPMSADRFSTLSAKGAVMVHIPFALGAIAVFHSVPAGEIGGDAINLDACLLAKIFSGKITDWDDADIKAQNPGLKVPAGQKIMVGHRTKGSSSTGGISGYLDKKCSGSWGLGAGSTITWPTRSNFKSVEGSPGMQAHIQGTPYAIGYLDAGHGHDLNFGEVALTNKDGKTRTSKESIALGGVADAGAAAVSSNTFPSDTSADWSAVNLYDMAGANTWPIVLVSYMYVKKDQSTTNPKTAAALKAFIKIIIENQDNLCQEFGFTPPSTTLKNLATGAADTIVYPAGTQDFVFESSTSAYTGMGANVISVKRNSYDIYEDGVLENSIKELQTKVAAMATPAPTTASKTSDGESSDVPLILSIVALVISLIAGIPGCWALKKGVGSQARDNLAPSTLGAQS